MTLRIETDAKAPAEAVEALRKGRTVTIEGPDRIGVRATPETHVVLVTPQAAYVLNRDGTDDLLMALTLAREVGFGKVDELDMPAERLA